MEFIWPGYQKTGIQFVNILVLARSDISERGYVVVSQPIGRRRVHDPNHPSVFGTSVPLRLMVYDRCAFEQWLIHSVGSEGWRPKQVNRFLLIGKTAAERGKHIRSIVSFGG